jgi:hypothetical protein
VPKCLQTTVIKASGKIAWDFRYFCLVLPIGKKSETSPAKQAMLEAQALHTKQLERAGYTLEIDKDGGGTLQCDGFNVRMRGADSERKHIAQNPHEYVGKLVTVRYFAMTEFNKPQFPVGVCIREDLEK